MDSPIVDLNRGWTSPLRTSPWTDTGLCLRKDLTESFCARDPVSVKLRSWGWLDPVCVLSRNPVSVKLRMTGSIWILRVRHRVSCSQSPLLPLRCARRLQFWVGGKISLSTWDLESCVSWCFWDVSRMCFLLPDSAALKTNKHGELLSLGFSWMHQPVVEIHQSWTAKFFQIISKHNATPF